MPWSYSGVGLKALGDSLRDTGQYDAVMAKTQPATQDALARPSVSKWHDGRIILDLTTAMDQVLGAEAVERVYYQHVRRSIGPLMMPFVKVVLLLSGRDPSTVFSRFEGLMGSMVRGVGSVWEQTSPLTGVLKLRHDEVVQLSSFRAWQGVTRYTFEICEVEGQMRPRLDEFNARDLVWDVSWRRL